MKYIRKIFEVKKKELNIIEEFQSVIDIIGSLDDRYFSWSTTDRTYNSEYFTIEYFITNRDINEFSTILDNLNNLTLIVEDIKHVCSRLNGDGYKTAIISDHNYIEIDLIYKDSEQNSKENNPNNS